MTFVLILQEERESLRAKNLQQESERERMLQEMQQQQEEAEKQMQSMANNSEQALRELRQEHERAETHMSRDHQSALDRSNKALSSSEVKLCTTIRSNSQS